MDMPRNCDLYFFIDFHPALFSLEKGRFKNTVFYWNDSFHFTFAYPSQVADRFDVAFMSERASAKFLTDHGYPVQWLPAAFYPGLYRPLPEAQKVHDYGFIGQQDSVVVREGKTRREFLVALGNAEGLHGYIGQGVYGDVVNQVYNESRVLFDRTIWYNIGTRIFEVVGGGGFFLMNRLPNWSGLEILAQKGIHYVEYDDSYPDFEEKMRRYLEDDEARIAIAERGRKHFLENHTYAKRLETIFRFMEIRA